MQCLSVVEMAKEFELNIQKPIDNCVVKSCKEDSLISLVELCAKLSISVATGRNWLKLGKITPQVMTKKGAFFSIEYANNLKSSLEEGKNTALKSRRNKKYVSGNNNIYDAYVSENSDAKKHVQAILDYIKVNNISVDKTEICTLLAE